MQTFLPYPDFGESVRCLDYRRLGKQRVEAQQLIDVLMGIKEGWKNHPACKMWYGYAPSLMQYKDYCIAEWVRRGYKNNMLYLGMDKLPPFPTPSWFGNPAFHAAHRSNLLRKDAEYYGQFGWTEPDNLEYMWPKP